jgi:hypothetical protein
MGIPKRSHSAFEEGSHFIRANETAGILAFFRPPIRGKSVEGDQAKPVSSNPFELRSGFYMYCRGRAEHVGAVGGSVINPRTIGWVILCETIGVDPEMSVLIALQNLYDIARN